MTPAIGTRVTITRRPHPKHPTVKPESITGTVGESTDPGRYVLLTEVGPDKRKSYIATAAIIDIQPAEAVGLACGYCGCTEEPIAEAGEWPSCPQCKGV